MITHLWWASAMFRHGSAHHNNYLLSLSSPSSSHIIFLMLLTEKSSKGVHPTWLWFLSFLSSLNTIQPGLSHHLSRLFLFSVPITATLINPGIVSVLIVLDLSIALDKVDTSFQIQTFLSLPSRTLFISGDILFCFVLFLYETGNSSMIYFVRSSHLQSLNVCLPWRFAVIPLVISSSFILSIMAKSTALWARLSDFDSSNTLLDV